VIREIEDHRVAPEALCRRFQVRRLELFGSAIGETFDLESSDLDLIVEFDDRLASGYADAYFGLAEALRDLFHRDVDLVVLSAVKNPCVCESIERSRTLLSRSSPRSCERSKRYSNRGSRDRSTRRRGAERRVRCPDRTLRKVYAPAWERWTPVEAVNNKMDAVSEKP